MRTIVILHNIRSAHNVGSIFRTSDAAGVSEIILSGYTPGLVDPRGKVRKEFVKVSLGAETSVPHTQVKNLAPTLKKLKKEGYTIIGIEQDKRSASLFDFKAPKKPLAIIFGNEVLGLSPQLKKQCDHLLEIPMRGTKESLNVSVAAGIALFELIRR